MGYVACVRSGYFGKGKQVQASTVASTITAVGKKIAMDTNTNPTKLVGSEQFIICIQELLDGYCITDPPTEKKLLIEADVPELLFELGYGPSGTTLGKAVGDLTLIALVKGTRNESKRMVQFKFEDVTFFHRNEMGQLRCLPRDAPLEMLLSTEGVCLKLDNQKNKGSASISSTMVTHYNALYGHWLGVLPICEATMLGHGIICPHNTSTVHAKMSRQKTSANTSN